MKIRAKDNKKDITEVVEKMPQGWRKLEGTLTQPVGTIWIDNNKSFFDLEHQQKLLIVDKELFETRIKEISSFWEIVKEEQPQMKMILKSYQNDTEVLNVETTKENEIFKELFFALVEKVFKRTNKTKISYQNNKLTVVLNYAPTTKSKIKYIYEVENVKL